MEKSYFLCCWHKEFSNFHTNIYFLTKEKELKPTHSR